MAGWAFACSVVERQGSVKDAIGRNSDLRRFKSVLELHKTLWTELQNALNKLIALMVQQAHRERKRHAGNSGRKRLGDLRK